MIGQLTNTSTWLWLAVVFGYYFIATLLPIDKLIGRFYPIFALCLLISSVCLITALFMRDIPPFLNFDLANHHPQQQPLFPLVFVTIACGAISGFHATQSPMMARCLTNQKYGRPVFYGAMILEGIVALIWATLGLCFYENSSALLAAVNQVDTGGVVSQIAKGLLGEYGGLITITSVIILAITTGDTCFRSARLSLADFLKLSQDKLPARLTLTLLILAGGVLLSLINVSTIWRYFGWFNQTLAMFTLWLVTVYLYKAKKFFWISFIPAVFMTAVSAAYIAYDKLFLNLSIHTAHMVGLVTGLLCLIMFLICAPKWLGKK
jgi:carbon starvation protein CstA